MSKPTVGRIVHYVSLVSPGGEFKPQHRAAIISDVLHPSTVDVSLVVLNPNGMYFNLNCPQDEEAKAPGTWHWPERED